MRAQLDADLALVLKRLPSIEIETTTPKSFRELLRSLAAASGAFPLPSVQSIEDISVKGAAGALKARVYRPTAEVSPTVVFFHGGGCVGGDIETHDRSARRLAIETGAVVISVDYRLAPELGFPEHSMTRLRPSTMSQLGSTSSEEMRSGLALPGTAPGEGLPLRQPSRVGTET